MTAQFRCYGVVVFVFALSMMGAAPLANAAMTKATLEILAKINLDLKELDGIEAELMVPQE